MNYKKLTSEVRTLMSQISVDYNPVVSESERFENFVACDFSETVGEDTVIRYRVSFQIFGYDPREMGGYGDCDFVFEVNPRDSIPFFEHESYQSEWVHRELKYHIQQFTSRRTIHIDHVNSKVKRVSIVYHHENASLFNTSFYLPKSSIVFDLFRLMKLRLTGGRRETFERSPFCSTEEIPRKMTT